MSGVTPVTGPAAGGNERAPRPTCPTERGKEKPPRAGSSKVKPPPALLIRGDPDRTKQAKLTAARRLYDNPESRRTVCALQRAGTPNVHLRLKPVASRPCTPTECHCVIDYDVLASQLGYVAQYGDGPLRPDAPYVRLSALPPPLALGPYLPHASSVAPPSSTARCPTRVPAPRRCRAMCVAPAGRSTARSLRRRPSQSRRGRRSRPWTSTPARPSAAAPSARRPNSARRRRAARRPVRATRRASGPAAAICLSRGCTSPSGTTARRTRRTPARREAFSRVGLPWVGSQRRGAPGHSRPGWRGHHRLAGRRRFSPWLTGRVLCAFLYASW